MSKILETHYRNMATLVCQFINDRKLVLWGQDEAICKLLSESDIDVSYYVTDDETLDDGKHITFEALKRGAKEYFILAVGAVRNKNDVSHLKILGYREGRDFLFLERPKTIISPETTEYSDIYGNVVHNRGGAKIILSAYAFGAQINIGEGCRADKDFIIKVFRSGDARVNIGKSCRLSRGLIRIYGSGQVTIGDNSYLSEGDQIICLDNDMITIGKDALFARNVTLFSGDGHAIFDLETGKRTNLYELGDPKGTIVVGDHVWIGMDVIVLNRASIGNNCIIGAKSLFKGELADNCIAAGNPARCIRKNATWAHSPFAEVPPGFEASYNDDMDDETL